MADLDPHKAAIKERMGSKSFTLMATAIAKVYVGSRQSSGSGSWRYTGVWGAAVVLINRALKTSIVRVYDIEDSEYTLRFEYEFHRGVDYYTVMSDQFHCFETTEMVVGLSFADAACAGKFGSSAKKFIKLYCKPEAAGGGGDRRSTVHVRREVPKRQAGSLGTFFGGLFGRRSSTDASAAAAAAADFDIGAISNVVHKAHVGLDAQGNMNMPDDWMNGGAGLKAKLRAAGVTKKQYKMAMQDPELKADVRLCPRPPCLRPTPLPLPPSRCLACSAVVSFSFSRSFSFSFSFLSLPPADPPPRAPMMHSLKKLDPNGVMILYKV